jgi:hypothetical protein
LYPLDVVYARSGVPQPVAKALAPTDLPGSYRSLLDHERDMTGTLERHCGDRVALRVLASFAKGRSYFRQVLLVEESTGRPLEMGAVRLNLAGFPTRIRGAILRSKSPLGRLLRDSNITFHSRPKAFFAIAPNSEMMGVFWMPQPSTLYGRQTAAFVGGKRVGDIVEILPDLWRASFGARPKTRVRGPW